MPRQPRIDFPGLYHHVICRGIEGNTIFQDKRDREYFLSKLGELVPMTGIVCLAWSIVLNHFHMFVRVGRTPLSLFMQRLLTGYAVYFNKRHKRSGHLFQNRYKSIVCEAEAYFLELLRYIHLNPLRAGIVSDLEELAEYRGCGHGVLLGRWGMLWQETKEVLAYFGNTEKEQRESYLRFIKGGLSGLDKFDIGGDKIVRVLRKGGGKEENKINGKKLDTRVLGGSDFAQDIFKRMGELSTFAAKNKFYRCLLKAVAKTFGLSQDSIMLKSRRGRSSDARSIFIYVAVCLGKSFSETGVFLGISRSAAWYSFKKGEVLSKTDNIILSSIYNMMVDKKGLVN